MAKVLHCGGHVALTADNAKRSHTRATWPTNARSLGKTKLTGSQGSGTSWETRVLSCWQSPPYSALFHTIPYFVLLTVLFWSARQSTRQHLTEKADTLASYRWPPLSALVFRCLWTTLGLRWACLCCTFPEAGESSHYMSFET